MDHLDHFQADMIGCGAPFFLETMTHSLPKIKHDIRKKSKPTLGRLHSGRRPSGSIGPSFRGAVDLLILRCVALPCAGLFLLQVEKIAFGDSADHLLVISLLLLCLLHHGRQHLHRFCEPRRCQQVVPHQYHRHCPDDDTLAWVQRKGGRTG